MFGRRVNIFLSNEAIGMIDILTGNRSGYIEDFIRNTYEKKIKRMKK